ncbi:gliding motility-associated C-terminal domain-containing protein [Chitinophaga sancti]|uniref:Gliding motility-associated C-terminal domain-containing protein n=1 Tax=Chitinophaga sancti TaxID=1004 RepID=A0A1K1PWV3_9BACT|nr:gliding motility-associated C-terminal domain-containing protein [Chitinophaga sancti]WQD61610.1 gliding motility-associated C-terminal domain-containing protein [Chitinophaga sancti]WQG92833.1 gliding motility-associated C-terminal domain-containing protein [Chitinophaga sancti]SFW51326.1 gliding motility-associated C-terminal domain-containing protein [Chitinophaga sancti]
MRNLYPFLVFLLVLLGSTTAQASTPFTYNTTCQNDSIRFIIATADRAGIDSVKWYYGDPASGKYDSSKAINGVHLYNTLGDYTITLVAYRSGVEDISTNTITVVAPVPYDFGPTDSTLCEGTTITLTAPYVAGAAYMWQDSSTSQSIVVDSMQTYKVKINGCLVPDSMNVFYTPRPEIELGNDVILCLGETLQLDATAQNCTFSWNTGATTPDIIVHSDTARAAFTYIVNANAKGCGTFIDSIRIAFGGTVHPYSLGPDTLLCPGETVIINGATSGATAYLWSTGATTPTVSASRPADLWCYATINNTCNVIDSIRVRYNALRNVNLGNDTIICKGEKLVLTADFGTGTYRWQDTSKQATYYVTKTGYYYVRAQIGRCVSSDTVHVQIEDTLRVSLGRDTVLCSGEVYTLYPKGAGSNYKWQDSSTVSVFKVNTAGIYAVVAQNTCGTAIDSVEVGFKDCDCQVWLPSGFSPNGDGNNDLFRPKYKCPLQSFSISVYNRWGAQIYYTTDPDIGWTGTRNGTRVPVGTYVYVMEYTVQKSGEHVRKTGAITLIR